MQRALSVIDTSKRCLLANPQDVLVVSFTLYCKINSELLFWHENLHDPLCG